MWPDASWPMQLDTVQPGELVRDTQVRMPPMIQREREVPHAPQVIFA
jgi:hypothetical protein